MVPYKCLGCWQQRYSQNHHPERNWCGYSVQAAASAWSGPGFLHNKVGYQKANTPDNFPQHLPKSPVIDTLWSIFASWRDIEIPRGQPQ